MSVCISVLLWVTQRSNLRVMSRSTLDNQQRVGGNTDFFSLNLIFKSFGRKSIGKTSEVDTVHWVYVCHGRIVTATGIYTESRVTDSFISIFQSMSNFTLERCNFLCKHWKWMWKLFKALSYSIIIHWILSCLFYRNRNRKRMKRQLSCHKSVTSDFN